MTPAETATQRALAAKGAGSTTVAAGRSRLSGYVVRNQTPLRLRLEHDGRVLELAPLQARRIATSPCELGAAEAEATSCGALLWAPEPVREVRERWAALVLLLGTASAAGLAAAVWLGTARQSGLAAAALLGCLLALSVLNRLALTDDERWTLRMRARRRALHQDPYAVEDFNSWDFARGVLQRVLQTLLLLVVLAVGLAVPAAAVWYGTGLSLVLDQLDGAAPPGMVANEVVARTLQVLLIGLLVLMPALMYFWFDREKIETLLDRWLHHIFRFDPTLRTLGDVDAKYGRRLEEAYGTVASGVSLRPQQRARSRAPVVMATLLVALGWVLVLVNIGSGLVATPVPVDEAQVTARTSALFSVATTPISFAFLGAYVYALQVVFRGYVRGDLRPKTYNAISVRIIVAFVLAGVLQGVLPEGGASGTTALTLAFLAGIVPDTVLRRIRDVSGLRRPSGESDDFADQWPLTDLVGIDLYERTRLAEEGITNVQALAHHDVVALTLSTRIPFERVVNWVDQAVLYEHVTKQHRARLRKVGVTTATALLEVSRADRAALEKAVPALEVGLVVPALQHADWVPMLLAWRTHRQTAAPALYRFPRDPARREAPPQVPAAPPARLAGAATVTDLTSFVQVRQPTADGLPADLPRADAARSPAPQTPSGPPAEPLEPAGPAAVVDSANPADVVDIVDPADVDIVDPADVDHTAAVPAGAVPR